ncbi:GTPase HflX [Snodgrassella alvi]|uniref:GTPase HflX n=1 Tax=Snodgrassella alvi TaxID=1196083 RepID=UPI000A0404E8|nr:GTPase HflX [Snodgrassella alvi]ORF00906.1 GTPase HflX [Snodgrassella alvi]ORF07691.1 GTPase HflX [Snodgrassella alvi]ORF10944.1 GTPase HflX [Snodgrassella alvi]ORF12550.1 GTPase HflX [Snodgrassella alvi]ORF18148.1 GTPase HflX [Snodgrassella alvi]
MSRFDKTNLSEQQPERVLLVGVLLDKDFPVAAERRTVLFESALAEAEELVRATGADLVEVVPCKRLQPDSALFVGKGKAEELAQTVAEAGIDLVVFNHALTPTQERNLERLLQCRVLDRVGLILAIFARRAQSQEGRLQVELAQLVHLSSRLVRGYGHLQSQRGGIGLRGPGETRLETDRRLIRQKITRLRQQLQHVRRQRATQRKSRYQGTLPAFALVGYTNVGKSSLFNRLTKAQVMAEDQLFATLDNTVRRLYLNDQTSVLLSDTVGFIRDLPHGLVAAFAATLEETALADVLLHVVDITHPEFERQIDAVNTVLQEIDAENIPQLIIYNKIDKLPAEQRMQGIVRDIHGRPQAVYISVQDGSGLDDLRTAMIEMAGMKYAQHNKQDEY